MGTDSSEIEGLQKIDVKFPLETTAEFNHDVLLSIFGRWRLEEHEEIIDLADYLHVPDSPGCLLVSHRWQFGIDSGGGQPGLFYSSRKGLRGEADQRFTQVIQGCLEKGKRLLAEGEIPDSVRPRLGELNIVINDRVLAPNSDETDDVLAPGIRAVADRLYGKDGYEIERERDPRRRLGYLVRAKSADGLTIAELLRRLES